MLRTRRRNKSNDSPRLIFASKAFFRIRKSVATTRLPTRRLALDGGSKRRFGTRPTPDMPSPWGSCAIQLHHQLPFRGTPISADAFLRISFSTARRSTARSSATICRVFSVTSPKTVRTTYLGRIRRAFRRASRNPRPHTSVASQAPRTATSQATE